MVFTLLLGFSFCFSSFINDNTQSNLLNGDTEVSSTEIWSHMQKKVFPKLNDLAGYDKKKNLFSRCPSGFGQSQTKSKSSGDMICGIITFAEGCSRDKFCHYQINWETKETKLKKKEKDEFVAISTFVKSESQKIAKI